ncbi:glycosyltransferase [Knoellia sp. CPCC 206435]|uniref:glycosyltransferase n=1 Tax=Knoellia terrae TaxID=3404797 RepID=UPI003B42D0F4
MRILLWHVHGSWTTSFVSGGHDYVIPLLPDRGPDGRGRARTWDWPDTVREVPVEALADEPLDVVVLQRPHEAALLRDWTGLRAGHDVPAVYLEHNAPTGHAVCTAHPVTTDLALTGLPVVHVTHFNAMAWDCGPAPTVVVEHGIPDPGPGWTGEIADLAVVVNEPVRRGRVAGTDLVLDLATELLVSAYGMGTDALGAVAEERGLPGLSRARCHDLDQAELHRRLGRHRAYLHPYRWTSLGLSLLEAMALGMPVLALATTEHHRAVPPGAGVVTNDLDLLRRTAARWLADRGEALERGLAAREHVLSHYGLDRFLADWDQILKEVAL